MFRYDDDGTAAVVASWAEGGALLRSAPGCPSGATTSPPRCSGRGGPPGSTTTREASGSIGAYVRGQGIGSAVGTPIVVGGRLLGGDGRRLAAREPLPAGTEARIGEFTELVATAISNMQARTDLAASRARIVAAADDGARAGWCATSTTARSSGWSTRSSR